ncbi:MAG TPA: AcrB/AcrD/AcrF family protein [Sphingomonas sp.]
MTADVIDAEPPLPKQDEADFIERMVAAHWRLITLLGWAATCAVLLWMKWNGIHWFALGDTDDNMRFDQVRDWLAGQGWYDLRQYRLNPPAGFSIHWSRLVDLPIAAILVTMRPLFGEYAADRIAVAVAPMLPMLPAFLAMTVTARRLAGAIAYPMALAILVCASGALAMWTPLRIDHHGWQLAFLMITVAALTDPAPVRSGIVIALSSALSLVIGLELLPYAVFAGAAIALHWAWDRAEARRMGAYGLTMAAATALGFLVFASNDNWHERCDALTPVWLSVVVLGALLLAGLSRLPIVHAWARLASVAAAGAITVAVYALGFPQCFGHRLEGVSPEVATLWLSHVREARPIYTQSPDYILRILTLPVIGAIGAGVALWRSRGTRAAANWLPILLFTLFAGLLTLWQVRTGPSAQMLAVPGATWLALFAISRFDRHRMALVRVIGPVIAFLICSGLAIGYLAQYLPDRSHKKTATANVAAKGGKPAAKKPDAIELANRRCPTIPAMAPIGALPPALFLTHVDLGPRLITLTHHSAIAGPYHRNGDAILDTLHAFRGTPDEAHAIVTRHHAGYVLVCPNLSEATIYKAEAPAGFYAKLMSGYTPAWLARVPLPAKSPFVLWKVVG